MRPLLVYLLGGRDWEGGLPLPASIPIKNRTGGLPGHIPIHTVTNEM